MEQKVVVENLKIRWIIILVIIALALVSVWPNFIDINQNSESRDKNSFLVKNRIVEGLDIQGGLQLVMGVDVEEVLKEKISRLPGSLKESLDEQGIVHGKIQVDPQNPLQLHVGFNQEDQVGVLTDYIETRDHFGVVLRVLEKKQNILVVQYVESSVHEYRKQVVDQAIEVLRDRIDEFGVAEPNISSQGSDRILVQLPGIEDTAGAKELIHRSARLNFRAVSKKMEIDKLNALIAEAEEEGDYSLETGNLTYAQYVERLNEDIKSKLPENTKVIFEKNEQAEDMVSGKIPHLVEMNSDLGGEHLEDAVARPDENGRYEVIFRFSPDGKRRFAELTEKTAPGFLAIVLDGIVKSAPSVKGKN